MEIIHSEGLLWTPVRTKPRREKKVQEYCAAVGIPSYLPLRRSVKRYERKTMEFFPPLFPSYIFCQVDFESFKTVLVSHGVLFRVNMTDMLEEGLIRDLQSVQVLEVAQINAMLMVKPEIVVGTPVKINSGPFMGVTGIVERRGGELTVSVNIDLLGQSVSVTMDIGDVESMGLS